MRNYSFISGRHGGFMLWQDKHCSTNLRIRHLSHYLFRRFFGRAPDDLCWHSDGFMAECRDRRGNFVEVQQLNWNGPLLPVRSGICVCGNSPIVGLSLCPACHQEAS